MIGATQNQKVLAAVSAVIAQAESLTPLARKEMAAAFLLHLSGDASKDMLDVLIMPHTAATVLNHLPELPPAVLIKRLKTAVVSLKGVMGDLGVLATDPTDSLLFQSHESRARLVAEKAVQAGLAAAALGGFQL